MTDLEIEKGCKQGDNKARKELYIRYSGLMFALIMRYVGDKEQSEDLLHDGFISVFGSFDKFVWRGEGSLRAWMSRLFVNVALGWLRDKKDFEVSVDEIPEAEDDPEEPDVAQIPKELIMQFITELPTGYRTVFNLYAIEGLQHKEIAKMLNITERSSSSQFFRAKKILAHRILSYLGK